MLLDGEGQKAPAPEWRQGTLDDFPAAPSHLRRVALADLARHPDRPYCVLDIETTGLDPRADRVWEIAAVRVEGGSEVGRYHAILDPGIPIPPEIQQICGVTQDEIDRDGVPPVDALHQLEGFLRGAVVVTHNVEFDAPFIEVERQRALIRDPLITECSCSLTAARWYLPDLRTHALEPLAKSLGIPLDNAHRADRDVEATAGVVRELLAIATRTAADPAQETLSGEVYERVFGWRARVASELHGIPTYFVLTNREATALGRAIVLGWKPTAADVKRQALETAGKKMATKVDRMLGGMYTVEAWRGAPPVMLRMNPLWCSLCGPPPEGGWPCDHMRRGARKLALSEAFLDKLAEDTTALT
jgi:DNA polymerase III epsilon subunit-like protein